ncbi:helix-turn-helix transcriptional regulator [Gilliamella sp. B3172]|uniref:helix-turn-helix domain-containing protein n=1 Tax=Gilliamella sp. B3172 TaxID=2818006 RepID=UPI00226AA1A2|nr:helix-turn-helix transcriptional regulator [Gilliamella sp. B3172]MCX8639464.1 helix-turn-helix transcriptional regulator [Gilliamella sp. B3172]
MKITNKYRSIFCLRLKHIRLERGLSQKELGKLAGIDEFVASTRINRYEQGIHEASLDTAGRLAEALDIPLAYLYAEDDKLAEVILKYKKNKL